MMEQQPVINCSAHVLCYVVCIQLVMESVTLHMLSAQIQVIEIPARKQ